MDLEFSWSVTGLPIVVLFGSNVWLFDFELEEEDAPPKTCVLSVATSIVWSLFEPPNSSVFSSELEELFLGQ